MQLHTPGPGNIFLGFPTPLVVKTIPDTRAYNDRLRDIVAGRAREAQGVGGSNVGGWHSAPDFFDWPYPEARQLFQWVGEAVKEMTAFTTGKPDVVIEYDAIAWVNLLRTGAYNTPHTHPGCMWSGVYYVDVGTVSQDSPASGVIEFLDPRSAVDNNPVPGQPFAGKFTVHPEPGLLLLFPSWLCHYVHPYVGDSIRISISFNVDVRIRDDLAAR